MGYNTYTTTDLVNDITLLGHFPVANNTFTPTKLLRLATLELQTPVMKQILSTRGGYYLTYTDYAAASDGLFPIPSDCVAGALANVELIQSTTIIPVNPIVESEQFSTISPTSISYGYFLRGNLVQILPTPTIGMTRLWYIKRTNDLILTSSAARVIAINGAVISVSSLPSTFLVDVNVDACGDQPPFNILGTRQILSISGTDITLDSAVTTLSIGDWLALSGQTPIPQIPVEFRILLAWRVVELAWELQGAAQKAEMARKRRMEYMQDTFGLIVPRVQAGTKIISPVNGGFLAGNANKITNFPAGREI